LYGDDVLVWHDRVPRPFAVRYAYVEYQAVNLFNAAELPAVPFRTDDWPLLKLEGASD
jgi:sialate O-acetylesterase